MAPLIVLVVVTLLFRAVGHFGVLQLRNWRASVRSGLAAMFLFTAIAHFNNLRADLVTMVPPWVPQPEMMVTITGVCEIAGAIGLLIPRTRRIAGIALIVMLVALLPANIYAAQRGLTLGGDPVTALVPRIVLQVVFIALIWWSAVRARPKA
jgi:uncharacterized membrane protein